MSTSSTTDERDLAVLALQVGKTRELYDAEVQRLDVTRKRVDQTIFIFTVIFTFAGTITAWIMIQQYRFRRQFGVLINLIDKAVTSGEYTGPNGMQTIWAYEYGQLGSLMGGFTTPDLAVAIVDSYYDRNMNSVFLGNDNGLSTLQSMLELSKRGDYSANQIMCAALFGVDGAGSPNKCLPNCNVVGATTDAGKTATYLAAATAGLGGGAGTGMIAAQIARSAGAAGPVGAAVGAAVGLGFMAYTMFGAHKTVSDQQSQCQASLQGCVNVEGVQC